MKSDLRYRLPCPDGMHLLLKAMGEIKKEQPAAAPFLSGGESSKPVVEA
jgi:hypothetical protein